ncbi:type II secretion system F family protein [Rhodoblastus acidophilus]|uniref:Type II secretion system F family protein n=1 Tax=Candidatus Rhodoblastus alkanivorans TaxID=2954117 RepID=A0ABS9ZA56_9HYPH|nr:type II secretion system F family protein [Candidatus Rhodoblastus alkanivorans]MCI4677161.1 type II secretion system F family protein [Candidatus Rhodoblastus alkanivorans]MCI4684514.1 type II secretion system F family protein [Candidatus Rhodoblastus alkanivorans]MDI4641835.1 type II secretion system F family protein [Rhodoblastus acidophilus]
MPSFSYRALSDGGDLREGQVEAASREAAEEAVWRLGLTPFEWRDGAASPRLSLLSFLVREPKPSAARLAGFTREFATLEQADIPLDQSLRLLAAQNASPALRRIADDILKQVVDGASLSQALAARPDVFGQDYVQVVREGESVGRVGEALSELADMLERRQELRGRVQSALVYPALLVVMAIGSTAVVLGTLIPNIAPIFTDNGKPMPAGLQFILGLEAHGGEIALAAALLGAAIFFALRVTAARPAWRSGLDRFLLRLPAVGGLLRKLATARFARSLGSMLKAGAPMLQALDSARLSVSNHYLRERFAHTIEEVRGGARLSASLRAIDFFPPAAAQMIAIGEETGQTPAMLLRLAAMFERDTQAAIERVMSLLTPLLTVTIASVVGGLILTVMDAVLSINDLAMK